MPSISGGVSVVAHQLKNPLAIIRSYIEVLSGEDIGTLNEKQKEYLLDALKNIERMEGIISDLLDASRIEEKIYDIKPQLVDLGKVAKEIVDNFTDWAKAFNCETVIFLAQDLPLVYTDPVKIRHVIENLISNAIKYRESGRSIVEIKLQKKGKNVIFSCKDNGIGIPDKDFKKVFAKFFRAEDAITADPSGTGLGLYINKAIIKKSNGKIWFKKNKDKGMTFYFSLPVAQVAPTT